MTGIAAIIKKSPLIVSPPGRTDPVQHEAQLNPDFGLQVVHLSLLTAFEAKVDNNFMTFSEPHFGQGTLAVDENTSSSYLLSQSLHINSYIGIGHHLEITAAAPTAIPSNTASMGLHITAHVEPK
jgi:hypothetical protein